MAYSFDAVVVGAGVAGLNAAWVLAKKGFKTALIDSKPREKIGERACGDAIAKYHFDELGWFPPKNVINHYYKGVKVVSPSKLYEVIVPGEGVSVDSLKFGQWLLKRALDEGVELLDNHTLLKVRYDSDGVKAVYVKEKGKPGLKEVIAKAFIDASGARPALRLKLPEDWPISEKPYITDYNLAYREVIEVEEPVRDEDKDYAIIYLDTEIAPGGYWWYFPKESGRIVNIGLGVVWSTKGYNPYHQYVKYLKNLCKGRVIHSGGGLVPTRRPLPTLVWRNVGVAGDAAYTVNPIHGGGRASSMLSGTIVAKHIANALEYGKINEETLWDANKEYMLVYGSKQAGLDVLRMYLQKLSNEDFEFLLKKRIVDGRLISEIGEKGNLAEEIVSTIKAVIALLGKPSLLNQLRIVKKYMEEAKKMYLEKYPHTPKDFKKWIKEAEKLFDDFRKIIGYDPGPKVPW